VPAVDGLVADDDPAAPGGHLFHPRFTDIVLESARAR
jgi:hypothetical protein